jgi:hypothetical protein
METYYLLEDLPSGPVTIPLSGNAVYPGMRKPGIKGPMSRSVQLFNYSLPVTVAAPTPKGSTLPMMGVG